MIKGAAGELRLFERERQYSFIPCNFFVRREVFLKLGGYDHEFFDMVRVLYFREDADFGFRLLKAGKKIVLANDVVAYHPELYHHPSDYFRHARRYFFDPLLHRKHPGLFRSMIEVKQFAGFSVRRPFHYLSLGYIGSLLLALMFFLVEIPIFAVAFVMIALAAQYPIRLRYERAKVPAIWNLRATFAFLALPFYYLYWLIRGCIRFKNWSVIY
jgi:GT2 family glycosyltransferase